MLFLCQQYAQEDYRGFLLIYARNAFNKENRTAMLWVVRHEWPSGARFAFNCYRHWATLLITAGNAMGHLLHSKEGVTQGDTLTMVACGLGTPPPHLVTTTGPTQRHTDRVCR